MPYYLIMSLFQNLNLSSTGCGELLMGGRAFLTQEGRQYNREVWSVAAEP